MSQIVLDCVLRGMVVVLLHLLIAWGYIRAQLFGRYNFLRLEIASCMHIDQVSLIIFVCSIYLNKSSQDIFILSKSYDMLGNTKYKRHISTRRNTNYKETITKKQHYSSTLTPDGPDTRQVGTYAIKYCHRRTDNV